MINSMLQQEQPEVNVVEGTKLISKILLATDFSQASIAVVPFARALAAHYSAEIYLAHVVGSGIFPLLPANEQERILQEAKGRMRAFLKTSMVGDHDYKQIVCGGDAPEVLCELGQALGSDLIVLGTNGRRGLRRFALGSVAEEIFRRVPCPVLTIGPKARGTMPWETKLRRILFATDLHESSLQAMPYAMKLAKDYQAQIVLLHVAANEDEAREAHRRLNSFIAAQDAEAKIEFRVATGAPAATILKATRNDQVDVVIMGVRGGGTWERLATHAPGPVAYDVVAQAPCPVLTVRAHDTRELSDRDAA